MAMATTYTPLPAAEHSAQLRKAVIASTVGTAIEWYDFFLYGTAASSSGTGPSLSTSCYESSKVVDMVEKKVRFKPKIFECHRRNCEIVTCAIP
jgi:hypothetical protein